MRGWAITRASNDFSPEKWLLIVSVHLPKTAGTSFGAALERTFGPALLKDYADLPINTPQHERNTSALRKCLANADHDFRGVACIHGHFLPLTYLLLSDKRDITFVTWLRNPVDRMLSHYSFWQRSYDPENAPPLHRTMMEEEWTVERFCLGPEIQNLYCQFLYGFPLEFFAFVGITEYYAEGFAFFARHYMDASLEPERLNTGDVGADGYPIAESLRHEIERHHAKDMELYHRPLKKRRTTRAT